MHSMQDKYDSQKEDFTRIHTHGKYKNCIE